jgi:hypothetical protein
MFGPRGLLVACLLCMSACVLPARSYGAYEEKAANTAEAVLSAVGNAGLAVKASEGSKAYAPYITTLLDESEADASGAAETLTSIQPPDDASLSLFDDLEPTLADATSTLTDLRIAARTGRIGELGRIARPLDDVTQALNAFLDEHG